MDGSSDSNRTTRNLGPRDLGPSSPLVQSIAAAISGESSPAVAVAAVPNNVGVSQSTGAASSPSVPPVAFVSGGVANNNGAPRPATGDGLVGRANASIRKFAGFVAIHASRVAIDLGGCALFGLFYGLLYSGFGYLFGSIVSTAIASWTGSQFTLVFGVPRVVLSALAFFGGGTGFSYYFAHRNAYRRSFVEIVGGVLVAPFKTVKWFLWSDHTEWVDVSSRTARLEGLRLNAPVFYYMYKILYFSRPRSWFLSTIYYLQAESWNLVLLGSVIYAVYYFLTQRKKRTYFESGGYRTSMVNIFTRGLKAGGTVMGLAELGNYFRFDRVATVSAVADIIQLLGDVFASGEKPADNNQQNPDADIDQSLLVRVQKFLDAVKKLTIKHRGRISMFLFAVLCGVALYIYFHCPELLPTFSNPFAWLFEEKPEQLESDLEESRTGKNKRGRGALRARLNKIGRAAHRRNWTVYDVEKITYAYRDGKPIGDMLVNGKVLDQAGHYEIYYEDENGQIKLDEFDVEPLYDDDGYDEYDEDLDNRQYIERVKGGKRNPEPAQESVAAQVPGLDGKVQVIPGPMVINTSMVDLKSVETSQILDFILDPKLISQVESLESLTASQKKLLEKVKKVLIAEEPKESTTASGASPAVPATNKTVAVPKTTASPLKIEALKHEALVPSAQQWKFDHLKPSLGDVMLDSKHIGTCINTTFGLMMNRHVFAQVKDGKGKLCFLKEKVFEVPPIVKGPFNPEQWNNDVVFLRSPDGVPTLAKDKFVIAEAGIHVALVTPHGVNPGILDSIDSGPSGLQARATYTSENFDCGSPVINANGKIVGMHFAAGEPKKNNLFIPVTPFLLNIWGAPTKSKN